MDKRNSKEPKGERSGVVVASERRRGNKWKTTSIRSWEAVQGAINDLDAEHLRGLIYLLIMARAGDSRRLRDLVANWDTAPFN
jgi:hypothetical protein